MKRIVILLLIFTSIAAFGGNKQLDALKAAREKTIKREKDKRDAAVKAINAAYLKKLQELMTKLTKSGDLDAALAVRAEIKAITGK